MKFLPPAQLKIDLELRMTQSTTYSRSQIPLNFMMTTRLRTQALFFARYPASCPGSFKIGIALL